MSLDFMGFRSRAGMSDEERADDDARLEHAMENVVDTMPTLRCSVCGKRSMICSCDDGPFVKCCFTNCNRLVAIERRYYPATEECICDEHDSVEIQYYPCKQCNQTWRPARQNEHLDAIDAELCPSCYILREIDNDR